MLDLVEYLMTDWSNLRQFENKTWTVDLCENISLRSA